MCMKFLANFTCSEQTTQAQFIQNMCRSRRQYLDFIKRTFTCGCHTEHAQRLVLAREFCMHFKTGFCQIEAHIKFTIGQLGFMVSCVICVRALLQ